MPGTRIRYRFHPHLLTLLALLLGHVSPAAHAQLRDVLFDVDRGGGFVGLGGFVKAGQWTPIRVTLANQSAELREVRVQWVLNDEDGDRVIAQRIATLNPMRTDVHVWLYACPPTSTRPRDPGWSVRVLDHETGRPLGQPLHILPDPARFLRPSESVMGVMSSISLGLGTHTTGATAHEPVRLATGLDLTRLPDRWYGMSVFQTLIWTHGDGEGGDPNDPAFTDDQQQALREWVRRGGHLVIVLPAYGEPWSGSPLADLMPVPRDRMRRVEDLPPVSLGVVRGAERAPIAMTVFDTAPGDGVAVIEEDRRGRPIVVARRFGFGNVTLIGVDLADRNLVNMGLPNGKWTIWHEVFGWRAPAFAEAEVEAQIKRNELVRPEQRQNSAEQIGADWLPGIIDMTGTATPALLLAILIFIVYWLAAGPGVFGALRAKGWHRHAWLAFVLVVAGFTAVTWAGAMLMRKGQLTVAHFSVLDIDGNTGAVHSRGWMSIFIPQFGTAEVALDPDHPDAPNTLASPGIVSQLESGRFPDQQAYTIDAGAPTAAPVPVRATAKRFIYDYAGRLDDDRAGLGGAWIGPQGQIDIVNAWPEGELTHQLPGPLHDVVVVYCPGDAEIPWVWFHRGRWNPGDPLKIQQPTQALRLVVPRHAYTPKRDFAAEGYLGQLIDFKTGMTGIAQQMQPSSGLRRDAKQQFEMLCFFNALPPPNFRDTSGTFGIGNTRTYHRLFGRDLDITPHTRGKRLILLGYLPGGHLPAPLTVDGRPPEQITERSWTAVRWIYDLE